MRVGCNICYLQAVLLECSVLVKVGIIMIKTCEFLVHVCIVVAAGCAVVGARETYPVSTPC